MSKPLVIYHDKCLDGMTAAWAVRKALGEGDYIPANHGDAPPEVAGRDVVIVDFSYRRAVMEEMAHQAHSLLILDHHKSAEADLHGLPYAVFDMQRSGAGLAWDWFHPEEPRPALVNYVEDGDLWRHALVGSKDFQLRLDMEPLSFDAWERVALLSEESLSNFIREGSVLSRAFAKDIAVLLEDRYPVILAGLSGLGVNATGKYTSELGHQLAVLSGSFGMVWRQTEGHLKVSLRSNGEFDVAQLAVQFGGGGHRNAAAFTLPIRAESYQLICGNPQ